MSEDKPNNQLVRVEHGALALINLADNRILSEMTGASLVLVRNSVAAPVDLDALVREGVRLYHNKGEKMTGDNVQAFNLFLHAAINGHHEGEYRVSWCYKRGRGIQENLTEAEAWLRKGAAGGSVRAQLILGLAYLNGNYCPTIAKDEEEAIKWLRKAAEGGTPSAYLYLVSTFCERKDYRKVVNCYTRAADLGSDTCLFYPEVYFSDPADAAEALKWYRKAAEDGSVPAQYHLGERYEVGRGVPQSDTEAAEWFRKAAAGWFRKATEKGDQHAQYFLGHCYSVGRGVPLELAQAHAWFQLAADQGEENAKKEVVSLAVSLSPSELEKAEALRREFYDTHHTKWHNGSP